MENKYDIDDTHSCIVTCDSKGAGISVFQDITLDDDMGCTPLDDWHTKEDNKPWKLVQVYYKLRAFLKFKKGRDRLLSEAQRCEPEMFRLHDPDGKLRMIVESPVDGKRKLLLRFLDEAGKVEKVNALDIGKEQEDQSEDLLEGSDIMEKVIAEWETYFKRSRKESIDASLYFVRWSSDYAIHLTRKAFLVRHYTEALF